MMKDMQVLDFALDLGLDFRHMNDSLGDALHGDTLTSDGMRCH